VPDRSKPAAVVELGCGDGVNLFEIAGRIPIKAVGYELDRDAVQRGRRMAKALGLSNIEFRNEDATLAAPAGTVDIILLIDFLEHIHDPQALLRRCDDMLAPGGRLIISVPTPRYPQVFGQRFHQAVGHVVDGYRLEDLRNFLPDYELVIHKYNTGLLASALCAFFYRVLSRVSLPVLGPVLRAACIPLTRFDWMNGESLSCSLFAVFQKPLHCGAGLFQSAQARL
jgi:SAM-dependent methyltransferase